MSDAEILERVVALNAARAAEEAQGHIRWLRPDYQRPLFETPKQTSLGLTEATDSKSVARRNSSKPKTRNSKAKTAARAARTPWPKTLSDRVKAVETALAAEEKPATAADLARRFSRASAADIAEIFDTLVTLGRARPGDTPGTFVR